MRSKNLGVVLSIIAIAISLYAIYICSKKTNKVAFVLVTELFNEFDLKKEMEKKYTEAKTARKKIIDSLEIDLSVLVGRIQMKTASNEDKLLFERKRFEHDQKSKAFDEDNTFMSKQFDEQIVKQLNQYVSDFGKENHYDMIYGNTTDGSIMYGTDEFNVTKDVINYINKKYKGVK